jgi:acyl-CoA synthetase (AMP-forming)/AMP-acid ligase II
VITVAGTSDRDTLVSVVRGHALRQGHRPALTFVADLAQDPDGCTLSYRDLDAAARRLAGGLQRRYRVGDRVVLLYPAGLQFAVALLGCVYAGLAAVPAAVQGGQHVAGIARDARAVLVMTDDAGRALAGTLDVPCATIGAVALADPDEWVPPPITPATLALLQYTSGSTSEPRGVMINHRNILAQVAMSRRVMGADHHGRFGGWLPMHHDLGLMSQLLQPLTLGAVSVTMPPLEFLKRPRRWLELVDRHRLEYSLAPNFAYELCCRRVGAAEAAGLDLSGWLVAGNGAEAAQASTLAAFAERFAVAGFNAEALTVGYGLAEATVYASVGPRGEQPVVTAVDADRLERGEFVPAGPAGGPAGGRDKVSCGRPCEVEVRIVDPVSARPLPAGRVGEIWLRGPVVADGYWADGPATARTFQAVTATGDGPYLRTGDLGAMWQDELYVTGRIKEMLVIRGRNLYPQDIEHAVAGWHEALGGGAGAVFATGDPPDRVVVVQECRVGPATDRALLPSLTALVRDELARRFGLRAGGVLLVRPGSVPRTSSGKVQRWVVRQRFLDGTLRSLYRDVDPEEPR